MLMLGYNVYELLKMSYVWEVRRRGEVVELCVLK